MRYFNPFQEILTIQRELERALAGNRAPARFGFHPAADPRNYPQVNVSEDADSIVVEALAPGLNPDSVQLSVLRNQLTIAGEKTAAATAVPAEKKHRTERAAGRFVRTLTLPTEVDESKVAAQYRAGILTITLPKAEVAKPRKIAVSVS